MAGVSMAYSLHWQQKQGIWSPFKNFEAKGLAVFRMYYYVRPGGLSFELWDVNSFPYNISCIFNFPVVSKGRSVFAFGLLLLTEVLVNRFTNVPF